jgi:hypothetical protein
VNEHLDQLIDSTRAALAHQAEQARLDEQARETANNELKHAAAELSEVYDGITFDLSRLLVEKGIPKESIGDYKYHTRTEKKTSFFNSKQVVHSTVIQEPAGKGWVIFYNEPYPGGPQTDDRPGNALYLHDDGQLIYAITVYGQARDVYFIGNEVVAEYLVSANTFSGKRTALEARESLVSDLDKLFRPLLEKIA